MTQLSLPLRSDAADDGGFLIGESNAQAVRQLERWGAWPVMAVIVTGPPKSGKSRLAAIMGAKSGGVVIDDAHEHDETRLFHAWNSAQTDRRPLFLVAPDVPPHWQVTLPDLRTRLSATPVARIGPPDDALVEELLAYLLEARQLVAKPELVGWMARRAERDHAALIRIADTLAEDAQTRSTQRLSIPTARTCLSAAGLLTEMKE